MPHRACAMVRDRTKYWGWVKTPVQFEAVCGPKFMKFCDNIGDPSYFPNPCRLSMSRFVQQILTIKSRTCLKTEQMLKFFAPFFLERRPQLFYSRLYHPPFGKVWSSSVWWSPSVKPGNKVECRIYGGWVTLMSNLKPFADQSSCLFEMMYREPIVVCNALTRLCVSCFNPKMPLKLPLSCEIVEKRWFWGPDS